MEEVKRVMEGKHTFYSKNAASVIKDAIVRSRYQASKLVNRELLGLYYGVGKYVSDNSRNGFWGKGAIKQISDDLQRELPGLRGFSETSIKKMRLFYEGWQPVLVNRPLSTDDLVEQDSDNETKSTELQVLTLPINNAVIDLGLLIKNMNGLNMSGFSDDVFCRVGFTHHNEILAKEKSLNGRLYYIAQCATFFWTVETLKSKLRGDLYSKSGALPNNFIQTLPEPEHARRAIRAFKDEYFLDYINIEDEVDPDERVIQKKIIADVKKFVLSFGDYFSFIGHRHRVIVHEKEYFIDLLFFNRELKCLVAIELKRGEFKPSQLGQLNFYLSALDEYVRLPHEAQSIGILLCKEAHRNTVEFAVRDYTKPMGVATYRTRDEMPESWRRALPDADDMRKLLDVMIDEQDEIDE